MSRHDHRRYYLFQLPNYLVNSFHSQTERSAFLDSLGNVPSPSHSSPALVHQRKFAFLKHSPLVTLPTRLACQCRSIRTTIASIAIDHI